MVGKTRRTVVLDDRPGSLRAIAEAARTGAFVIVAVTSDPAVALAAVPDADLAVLAVDGRAGPAVVAAAVAANPALVVVALADGASRELVHAAEAAGAAAVLPRTQSRGRLAAELRRLLESEAAATGANVGPEPARLTRRELELLELVAAGWSNADIARELWVVEQTVKFHLTRIYRKLGVRNRTGAAQWAHAHGLTRGDRSHG